MRKEEGWSSDIQIEVIRIEGIDPALRALLFLAIFRVIQSGNELARLDTLSISTSTIYSTAVQQHWTAFVSSRLELKLKLKLELELELEFEFDSA